MPERRSNYQDYFLVRTGSRVIFFPMFPPIRGYVVPNRVMAQIIGRAVSRIGWITTAIWSTAVVCGLVTGAWGASMTIAGGVDDLFRAMLTRRFRRRLTPLSVRLSLAAYVDSRPEEEHVRSLLAGTVMTLVGGTIAIFRADVLLGIAAVAFGAWTAVPFTIMMHRRRSRTTTNSDITCEPANIAGE